MKVIIMGCGRVGEHTSQLLAKDGHDVVVIDDSTEALARLGPDFKGRTVVGVGFDRAVLLEAGIEMVDGFAATSVSDNTNIVAARIARQIFHVPRVVARLYDPRRAEVYRRLGLLTISSTAWGAERICELLSHAEMDPVASFGGGEVSLICLTAPPLLVGRQVKDLTVPNEINVVTITRRGQAILPTLGTEFQAGDLVHLAVLARAIEKAENLLGLSQGG